MSDLISPDNAQRLIASHCDELKPITLTIEDALGHICAESVRSPISLPGFDNSAMDGYAFACGDTAAASESAPVRLSLAGTVYAGDAPSLDFEPGAAYRIMTGAPLPKDTDTVVAQENAVVDDGALVFTSPASAGRHVRRRGEEIEKGAKVLSKGDRIHPGAVGALAAVGREQVTVVKKPSVYLITTGDETVKPGQQLRPGQIYNSNAAMLRASLADAGIRCEHRHVRDNPKTMGEAARTGLKHHDVVVFVGGVSVGEKDFLREVLTKQSVKEVFWRVAQKPGKPLYFGTQGRRLVFGLPGNPASAFTCFYVYVYPALMRLAGDESPGLGQAFVDVDDPVEADPKKTRYLKARASRSFAEPLGQQGSHMITALVQTNSLVVVPPDAGPGQKYETLLMPYAKKGEA